MTIQQEQLDRAIEIAETFGATRLILFGSAARNPEQAKDIDLACDGVAGWKLFELGARLEEELKIGQYREVIRIIDSDMKNDEKKKLLIDTLNEYGHDIAENVLASILLSEQTKKYL